MKILMDINKENIKMLSYTFNKTSFSSFTILESLNLAAGFEEETATTFKSELIIVYNYNI